jgi:hypothetical protein
MLDTIRVAIPLSEGQHSKIRSSALVEDKDQWTLFNPISGEMRFLRHRGVIEKDGESYHRDIRWDLPERYYKDKTSLTVELSLPKFFYSHNIRLLYDWTQALQTLKREIEKHFHIRLPSAETWTVQRADICYAWDTPSQRSAQAILDALKRIHYPRKKPIIYDTSIQFTGATYSFKIYLKHPEFIQHDRKVLVAAKARSSWIDRLEKMAEGVIRVEATLRTKYLRRKGITTVADLLALETSAHWDLDCDEVPKNFNSHAAMFMVTAYHMENDLEAESNRKLGIETPIKDGMCLKAPKLKLTLDGVEFDFPGGSMILRKESKLTKYLQYFLGKFLGENRGMDEPAKVKEKLLKVYGSAKAMRLLGFWLHVQRFGTEDAKREYTKTVFYGNKSDLKKAGVSVLETIQTTIDDKFIENFKLDVPSVYVVNKVDDYSDHEHVINVKEGDSPNPLPSTKDDVI